MTLPVRVTVNGRVHESEVDPRTLLADFLRHGLGYHGTHVGCEHGVCGACTIQIDGQPVRSCLMLAVQADGLALRTVEGLADGERLHPLQQAFQDAHALQCGFCTPGFLMTLDHLLLEHPDPGDAEIRDALAGNLCRCTGYHGISAAVRIAAERMRDAASSEPDAD